MASASDGTRLIRALRLRNQGLVDGAAQWSSVADVARGMLAMQAQDPRGVLLALSVRAADHPTETEVSGELAAALLVRNRPSRGTLQVTAPEDLSWMSGLMAERSMHAAVKRRDQIGVTEQVLGAAGQILLTELGGGRALSRPEIVEACAAAGVPLDGAQAGHVLRHYTETMTIVHAAPHGRVDTFALAENWIAAPRELTRDEALAELAIRYFTARGPATVQCLAWWSNLPMGGVREAIEMAGPALEELDIDGTTFIVAAGSAGLTMHEIDDALAEPLLLAPFDEYLLGYRSRDAVVSSERLDMVVPGRNGMFKPILVVEGEVVGLWSRKMGATKVVVTIEPFEELNADAMVAVAAKVEEYGAFLERRADMVIADA